MSCRALHVKGFYVAFSEAGSTLSAGVQAGQSLDMVEDALTTPASYGVVQQAPKASCLSDHFSGFEGPGTLEHRAGDHQGRFNASVFVRRPRLRLRGCSIPGT